MKKRRLQFELFLLLFLIMGMIIIQVNIGETKPQLDAEYNTMQDYLKLLQIHIAFNKTTYELIYNASCYNIPNMTDVVFYLIVQQLNDFGPVIPPEDSHIGEYQVYANVTYFERINGSYAVCLGGKPIIVYNNGTDGINELYVFFQPNESEVSLNMKVNTTQLKTQMTINLYTYQHYTELYEYYRQRYLQYHKRIEGVDTLRIKRGIATIFILFVVTIAVHLFIYAECDNCSEQ